MRTLTFTEASLVEALGNVQCLHDMSVGLIAECVFENAPACSTCNDTALIGDAPIECPDCCGLEAPAPSAEVEAVEVVGQVAPSGIHEGAMVVVARNALHGCEPGTLVMTVAQHERIVAALREEASTAKAQQEHAEHQRDMAYAERDALQAKLAELEGESGIEFLYDSAELVSVPRGLLGAACHAIDKKRDAPRTIAKLREYARGLPTPVATAGQVPELLEWAVDRWHAEVSQRPLNNVHRRSLDDTWRQIIRRLGGDAGLLCGPAHDDLLAAAPAPGGE
ncbi:hypothetical protein D9M69_442230 [compost metagenome]